MGWGKALADRLETRMSEASVQGSIHSVSANAFPQPMLSVLCQLAAKHKEPHQAKSRSPSLYPQARLGLLEGLGQGRDGFEQVGHQAIVGDLEDRGFLVAVDGRYHLAVLHAREVLNGTGDADG